MIVRILVIVVVAAFLFMLLTNHLGAVGTGRVMYEQVYPGTTYVSGYHA